MSGAFVAAALMLPLLNACADDADGNQPTRAACTVPPALDRAADVPIDFPWPDGVTVTKAQLKRKFILIEGFGERSVEEFFETSGTELRAKGFDVINTDYEGFEAEIYFAKSDDLAGIVSLREGPCDGYVKVTVLYDPLETAAGRKAVRNTRRLSGEG